MSQRDDQVDDWNAINAMWARRCKEHPQLEAEMKIHQMMLARLDKELRSPETRPTFAEDIEAVMSERYRQIVGGPMVLKKAGAR